MGEEKKEGLVLGNINDSSEELQEEVKKSNSVVNMFILLAGVIIVLGLILLGVRLMQPESMDDWIKDIIEQGSTEHGFMYNGFVFVEYENLWHTEMQRRGYLYNLHFHYSPAHVDAIPVKGSLREGLDTSTIYITFDPLEENLSVVITAAAELNLNLVKGMDVRTITACLRNETKEEDNACSARPIVTCDDEDKTVLWVRSAQTTEILLDDNCAVMQGPDEEIFRAVDRLLYDWYGIIESP
jgi:hypothetical protein